MQEPIILKKPRRHKPKPPAPRLPKRRRQPRRPRAEAPAARDGRADDRAEHRSRRRRTLAIRPRRGRLRFRRSGAATPSQRPHQACAQEGGGEAASRRRKPAAGTEGGKRHPLLVQRTRQSRRAARQAASNRRVATPPARDTRRAASAQACASAAKSCSRTARPILRADGIGSCKRCAGDLNQRLQARRAARAARGLWRRAGRQIFRCAQAFAQARARHPPIADR